MPRPHPLPSGLRRRPRRPHAPNCRNAPPPRGHRLRDQHARRTGREQRLGTGARRVAAGAVEQQVDAGLTREAVVGAITADIPIGIIPPEDDCARAVLMMISDFSRVVTGASLDVNGGHWMAP